MKNTITIELTKEDMERLDVSMAKWLCTMFTEYHLDDEDQKVIEARETKRKISKALAELEQE